MKNEKNRILLGTSLLFLLGFVLTACEPSVPDGIIRVKNDSQDRSYNVVEVRGSMFSFAIKPGESVLLPRGTRNISFAREYKDFTRRYEVECPPIEGSGITIKLIDVHLNRLPGGCNTTSSNK